MGLGSPWGVPEGVATAARGPPPRFAPLKCVADSARSFNRSGPSVSPPKPTRRRPKPSRTKPRDERPPRLQKVLAAAGFGSRRACEQLIVDGRVEVDRGVVTELGTRVDAETQEIRVDGDVIRSARRVCYVVNKPPGVVATKRDPEGRARVIDFVPGGHQLFTVGRLDKASQGLILVTNDGDLANQLTHPRYGVSKTYRVTVAGHPTAEQLAGLRRGVHLAEGIAKVAEVRIQRRTKNDATLEIVLREGRNREIRRLLASIGHKVRKLQRVALGPLRLGDLPLGAYRQLTVAETRRLQTAVRHATRPTGRRNAPVTRKS